MTIRVALAETTTVGSLSRAMDPVAPRFVVYRHLVETGRAPSRSELTEVVGDLDAVDRLLRELHDRHTVVLDDRDHCRAELHMALPFAAEPTDFRVVTDTGARWANCA